MALVYPNLPGLTYSVFKTPQFKTKIQNAVSGRELRVSYQPTPKWLFKLKYDFLRGLPGIYRNGYNELTQLLGTFVAMQGSLTPFLFNDPMDNYVVNQPIGTGDGTTTTFQLVRSITNYGNTGFLEPIIAPNVVYNVFLNTFPVSDWTVNSNTGVVTFTSAPGSDVAISATFSYYFFCRFADDSNDFEQIMDQLWSAGEIKLQSVLL